MPPGSKFSLIVFGIACLGVSAFCDNLRAPLLPLFVDRWSLDYAFASTFMTAGCLAAFAYSLVSVEILKRLTERRFLQVSLLVLVAGLVTTVHGASKVLFLAAAVMWGAGTLGVGMASNFFVLRGASAATRSRWLNLLHFGYGVVSALPGLYLAASLDRAVPLLLILLTVPLALCAALLLWSFVQDTQWGPQGDAQHPRWREIFAPRPMLFVGAHAAYVLGEVVLAIWLPAYLHEVRGLPLPDASRYLTWFFLGLCGGRLGAAMALRGGREALVVSIALAGSGLCAAFGVAGWSPAFVAAAFFMGPVFPLLVILLAEREPRHYRALLAVSFSGISLALAFGHGLMGALSRTVGLSSAYSFPVACFGLSLALFAAWRRL